MYRRAYYQANKDRFKNYRDKKYAILNQLKNRPCMDCGGWFNPWQMEYDHRDPRTKVNNISRLLTQGSPMVEIYKEIKKCDLVCANCHQDRTHKNRHYYRRSDLS